MLHVRIMRAVRRYVAVFLLAMVTVLHATDPILCPDGCTDRDHTSQSASTSEAHQSTNVCLVCLASLLVGPEATRPLPAPVRREPVPSRDVRLNASPVRGIDHPPRLF